jgi:RNA polymerase sigma-70 factor (ECF subfamily)
LDEISFAMLPETQFWTSLVSRVRSGDPEAERELVDSLYPRVHRILRVWKSRREGIDDLAQEVYLRVFARLDQFKGGSFTAWVEVITRRVCYDALRRQRVRPEWTFADLGDAVPDEQVAPTEEDCDAAEVVSRLLGKIPGPQAWLLREVELAERSIGEVSHEMGWTAMGGRLRLFRARQALKNAYNEWRETV